jgi:hypothetical protein
MSISTNRVPGPLGHRRPNLGVLVLYCGVGFSLREALASLSRMSTGDAQAGLKSRAG